MVTTKSAPDSGPINVRDVIDNRLIACIAYIIRFAFGGTFLGIALMLVGAQLHGAAGQLASLLGSFFVGIAFRRRGLFFTLFVFALALFAFIGAEFAIRSLATMATNGFYGPDQSDLTFFYVGNYLTFGILWLIFGVPYRGFKYKIDRDGKGSSQDVVITSLAAAAAILTGVFILFLHNSKGPFSQVNIRALIVGAIFTVFLLAPIYRSIAKACWQRGLLGILSPRSFLARWRKAAIEIEATTLEYYIELQSRERKTKLSSRSRSGSEAARREPPKDLTVAADEPSRPRIESREAERKDNLGDARSTRPQYGRSSRKSLNKKRSSQKRRKRPHQH